MHKHMKMQFTSAERQVIQVAAKNERGQKKEAHTHKGDLQTGTTP
jgi:hypothetical protein